ncbi:hypothetical protein SARC_07401 [Sphaeroforma arctica JP610]|uniref:Uncharacterized protein n=1 Tax=Sphaeroforma arctica JP610 TaxID=667725 RepID=A0A0L0FTU3_9EUKA|nr:hypothetical protein SARC_07401 [Sphaeroforma arctica JP610]KNC80237.1 hypothetical protein SARC_07401 [Sphaeroforma arctica JP610]|eukprot:XP_014154139.1 hypothetical protein SARC_07401 [Sphaeroforma arctica JP610]
MPTSVTMPATWTADETAWLQGTCAQRQTITAADRLQKEFSDTYTPLVRDNETLFNGKVRTFAAYQLAAGLVSSRAFRVDDESEDSEMLPLADMYVVGKCGTNQYL